MLVRDICEWCDDSDVGVCLYVCVDVSDGGGGKLLSKLQMREW